MKPIICSAGHSVLATEGGEHGIHSPRPVGYGFRARRFAAPRAGERCCS